MANASKFQVLYMMASDILTIHISSECAFSALCRVLNKFHKVLLPSRVETLICIQDWIRKFGFPPDEDDEEIGVTFTCM